MVTHYHQALNRLLIAVLLLWSTDVLAQVTWPNEPAGSTRIGECSFSVTVCTGWVAPFGSGQLASDANAPLSPPSVLEYTIGPGQDSGGGDVGLLLENPTEVYLGFWLWLSDPLIQPGNQLQKIFTVMSEGGPLETTDLFWMLIQAYPDPTGPFYPVFHLESTTLNNSHLPGYGDPGSWIVGQNNWPGVQITQGVWHRIEFYLKRSSSHTTADGIARLWMDGELLLDVSPKWPGPITRFHFTPAWTGWTIYDIQITNRQRFDHAVVSVPSCGAGGCPQPIPDWPNEPTGTTTLLDFPFNVTQGSGLDDVNETGVIVSDSTAPLSPVNVFRSRLQNGIAPGGVELRYDLPDLTEMFSGVWWKPNTTFQGLQSGFNRLMGFQQAESPAYLAWVGAQNLSGLSGSIQFYMPLGATAMNNCHLTGWQGNCPGEGRLLPNMSTCTINATDDEWHRIELYVRRSASAIDRTGIVRWWVDGNLCGNYDPQAGTGVNWGPSGFDYWFWTEAWTTVPAGQSADWIHYLDHLYLSRPQGATSVDVMPPGPVTSFTVTIPGGPPPPDPPPVGVSPGAEWFQFF